MSYPIHRLSGGDAARTIRSESGFWGLDLTLPPHNRGFAYAIDTENMLWDGDALKVRPGFRYSCLGLEAPINGIYFYNDKEIIHAGSKLYRVIQEGATPQLLFDGLRNAPSRGLTRYQSFVRRSCNATDISGWRRARISKNILFISDGEGLYYYDGEAVYPMIDPYWNDDVRWAVQQGNGPIYFSATVPFYAVAKVPDSAIADMPPIGQNRLSQFVCESFYLSSAKETTDYVLSTPYGSVNNDIPPEIQLRDADGNWRNLCIPGGDDYLRLADGNAYFRFESLPLKGGMKFMVSGDGLVEQLNMGSHLLADDGLDNIRITYAIYKERPEGLLTSTAMGTFGADGRDDVLFLGGGKECPGEDAFSAADDFFCFYDTSREQLGNNNEPIIGYCRLNDGRLAVLKNENNGSNIYFRSHRSVSLGKMQSGEEYIVDAYPSQTGAAVEGCTSGATIGMIDNQPCFLGRSGLYSVRSVSDELTNLNETVRRSLSIDSLLQEQDAAAARSLRWKNYYIISFGSLAFITDGRCDNKGNFRFLKWRFPKNITALAQWNDLLYFGDDQGDVYRLQGNRDDGGEPIHAFWQAPPMEAGGGRRIIIRRAWAEITPGKRGIFSARLDPVPDEGDELEFDYSRMDFNDFDFSDIAFEGRDDPCLVSLNEAPLRHRTAALRLNFTQGADLKLWGLRVLYEKGGMMR